MLVPVRSWVPVPGSVKGRLIDAALHEFEQNGYEGTAVGVLAAKAGVTTGALYHHFGSKLGLYALVREDLEKRVTDRMEGAVATAERGRPAVRAALLVALDAADRFNACRMLGESHPEHRDDPVAAVLRSLLARQDGLAAPAFAAAWRATLISVADGHPVGAARRALQLVLG
jgi:AcrR family transcriptional regulator